LALCRDDALNRPEDRRSGDPVDRILWKGFQMRENVGLLDDPGLWDRRGLKLVAPFEQELLDDAPRWFGLAQRTGGNQDAQREAEGDR
jgi:hypothetical protein